MKAQSETRGARGLSAGRPGRAPGYIVGPGDTSDRFTYWPVRIARGGEVLVPGRKTDRVQYIDVRDLAEWMVRLVESDATARSTRWVRPPRRPWRSSSTALAPLAPAGHHLHVDRGLRVAEGVSVADADAPTIPAA